MIADSRLLEVIRDTIAQKRVIKWGYVRSFGGPSPSSCDSVAAHTGAVAALSVILAIECAADLEKETGVRLKLEDVALLAILHDLGECRSGDTGAAGHATHGVCDLHSLEREGLCAITDGLGVQERAVALFDDYRAYRTPEAILVHVADNIEGYEKGLQVCRGVGEPAEMALAIVHENLELYRNKGEILPALAGVCEFMVSRILVPSIMMLRKAYRLPEVEFPGYRHPLRAVR